MTDYDKLVERLRSENIWIHEGHDGPETNGLFEEAAAAITELKYDLQQERIYADQSATRCADAVEEREIIERTLGRIEQAAKLRNKP